MGGFFSMSIRDSKGRLENVSDGTFLARHVAP